MGAQIACCNLEKKRRKQSHSTELCGEDDPFWIVWETMWETDRSRNRRRQRDRQILHQCHGSLLGHTLNQRQMFIPFDQTTSAVAPLVSSSLPNYFSKRDKPKPTISKHADSSNSINVKLHRQQASQPLFVYLGNPSLVLEAGLQLAR